MVDKFRQVKGKTQGCQADSVPISSLDLASPCQVSRDGALRQQVLSGSRACPCGLQDSDKGSRQCTTGAVLQSGQAWVSAECSLFWQGGLEQICAGVLNCHCHCVCYCTYHSPAAQTRG